MSTIFCENLMKTEKVSMGKEAYSAYSSRLSLYPEIFYILFSRLYKTHIYIDFSVTILYNIFREVINLTEYLTAYMKRITGSLEKCDNADELDEILREHLCKIEFMQHERIVHFLVTFMFAVVLCIFMSVLIFSQNIFVLILVTIILVLLGFYIKHYYFLENTVQKMYVVYDEILEKRRVLTGEKKEG